MFAVTSVIGGNILKSMRYFSGEGKTYSIVMHSHSGTNYKVY